MAHFCAGLRPALQRYCKFRSFRNEATLRRLCISSPPKFRNLLLFLAILLWLPSASQSVPPENLPGAPEGRMWKSAGPDDGSIEALGNGEMMAYEQGPDVIQVFGPPYVSPTALSIRLENFSVARRPLDARGGRGHLASRHLPGRPESRRDARLCGRPARPSFCAAYKRAPRCVSMFISMSVPRPCKTERVMHRSALPAEC